MSTIFKNPPLQPRLIQPKSFEDCLTYGEQIYCLYKMILELDEKIDRLLNNNGGGDSVGGDDNPEDPWSDSPSEPGVGDDF